MPVTSTNQPGVCPPLLRWRQGPGAIVRRASLFDSQVESARIDESLASAGAVTYNPPMRRAAFFDLDGTLLRVNSAALWVQRERRLGKVSKRQLARALFYFAAYRLSFIDIEQVFREALATIRGEEEATFRDVTRSWYREEVAPRAAPGAFATVEAHRARGDLLVLVTSSSLYASEEAQVQFGLDEILCTRYELKDGRFTGAAIRPYCFGEGKVSLAEELAARLDVDLNASAFYTDSYTDVPLLARVGAPYVVNPDPRLRLEARRRRWPVLNWSRTAAVATLEDDARPRVDT
jgi:HAD superfamily hydrolase (TIGR01490 family)